jgi:hypothetical protein
VQANAHAVELQKIQQQAQIDERQSAIDVGDQELKRMELMIKMRELDQRDREIALQERAAEMQAQGQTFEQGLKQNEIASRQAEQTQAMDMGEMMRQLQQQVSLMAQPKKPPKVRIVRGPDNRIAELHPMDDEQPTLN